MDSDEMDIDAPAGTGAAAAAAAAAVSAYPDPSSIPSITTAAAASWPIDNNNNTLLYDDDNNDGIIIDYDEEVGGDDEDGEVSDADSDTAELQAEIARFDAQRDAFVNQQRGGTSSSPFSSSFPVSQPRSRTGVSKVLLLGRKGRKLGPRKAAKPTPDILFRLSLAKEAFERKEYDTSIAMLSEIIRINSETYNAWTLLSTVHEELGDREKATMCLMSAALLVPKNVPYWINAAIYALHGVEEMEDGSPEKERALERANVCYSHALTTDRTNIEARTGKADVLMMQGHATMALQQYQRALEYRPLNIRTVRNIADVALDARDVRRSCEMGKRAYRTIIDELMARGTFEAEEGRFEWSDLRIYLEFFTNLDQWAEGAHELKEISRWLLGRREEHYWEAEEWTGDDREWDLHDDRRILVPGYEPTRYPRDTYGQGLPVDLRAKLYVYRRKLGLKHEASRHLTLLDPATEYAVDTFGDFPDCLKDIAAVLLDYDERAQEALDYINLYRRIAFEAGDVVMDADLLVYEGRCHMALGDKSAAEECFIAAIEDDPEHIEARYELAKMYESEQYQEGREEAFLLVREAMNLEAKKRGERKGTGERRRRGPYKPRTRRPRDPNRVKQQSGERKARYWQRRFLIDAEKRQQQDLERLAEATRNYQLMQTLKDAAVSGDDEALREWMKAAKDLVDDFRSYKGFYPWEKYIKYLGFGSTTKDGKAGEGGGGVAVPGTSNLKLLAMAERLRQDLAPQEGQDGQKQALKFPAIFPQEHRGISFDKWLDIFLEYAFCLVKSGQHTEAYVVCHAARDSTVWTSAENMFLIHLAWASCAVIAGDEETCVAVARYFMRDYMPGTDSYRMFSAMCRVCQTPVSWYTSGPAQKFVLRQIKTMDNVLMKKKKLEEEGSEVGGGGEEGGEGAGGEEDGAERGGEHEGGGRKGEAEGREGEEGERKGDEEGGRQGGEEKGNGKIGLDVCLLTIYGHILFSTTSYTYALSYFARAASLDPHNTLINLSIGLAYLHYALKRQATNRQYLLVQAFAFLFRYYNDRLARAEKIRGVGGAGLRQEAHFNIARAYSLIGLGNLAIEYYKKVLDEAEMVKERERLLAEMEEVEGDEGEKEEKGIGSEDLTFEAAYNIRTICYLLGDVQGAKAVTERWLILE